MSPDQRSRLEAVTASVMDAVLDRSRGDDGYPWIDTKLDLIDGSPLSRRVGGIELYGRATVYGWIQGRGIEALAAHQRWFQRRGDAARAQRCLELALRVAAALERTRARTGGRLWFWLDADGTPFALDPDGRRTAPELPADGANFSDLFHARGLCALAAQPGGAAWRPLAEQAYGRVLAALAAERFASDQQPFDPRNPVVPVPGRHSYGARMIALGLCALGAQLGIAGALGDGLDLLDRIAAGHANRAGRWPWLPADTISEFIDDRGEPWREAGEVVCDPGHACELVGLALWLFDAGGAGATPGERARIAAHAGWLPHLLAASAARGLRGPGMCKLWSLSSERVVNGDMPWWSLPETMRACALLLARHPAQAERVGAAALLDRCVDGFLASYLNPRVHGWACQTLGPDGTPVRVVPATPDADPGYHTGCCLIQTLDLLP